MKYYSIPPRASNLLSKDIIIVIITLFFNYRPGSFSPGDSFSLTFTLHASIDLQ